MLASTPAWAGFDGTGAHLPVDRDTMADPMLTWRATRPARGAMSFQALFEAAADPLIRQAVDPISGDVSRERVVGGLAGIRLGGRFAISDRVELALTVPVWLAVGSDERALAPGLGDLRLHLPVGLAELDVGGVGLAAAVVPHLSLPIGANARYLGDDGPGLGVQGVGELTVGPVVGVAHLGMDLRSFSTEDNVRSGPGVQGGASVGVELHPRFGLHLGWRADGRLLPGQAVVPDAPRRVTGSELALTGRGHLFDRWTTSFGLSTLTQRGPGAADARLWVGITRSLGGVASPIADADVDADATDDPDPGPAPATVRATVQDAEGNPLIATVSASSPSGAPAPEPVSHGADGPVSLALPPGEWIVTATASGFGPQGRGVILEPDAPVEDLRFILLPTAGERQVELSVIDVNGDPVAGAELDVAGQPIGTTGSGGFVQVGGLASTTLVVDAQADTFRDLTASDVGAGPEPTELVLARERGAVQVVVRGPQGQPVTDASARFVGADRLGPFPIGEDGERAFVLRPGPWQLLVSSPRYGLQQRALDLPDRDTAMQVVEVVLQPPEQGSTDLSVRVVDADNNPIPQAAVSLDGVMYGTTSSGGELAVDDLREGPRTLRVSGEWLEPVEESVFLAGGLQEHTVVADYKTGSTLLRARGPTGMVSDATARFDGPDRVPTTPLGRDGQAMVQLDAGLWQVLVSSPSLGFQQQGVAIPPDSRSLHVVEAVLNPGEAGVGRLSVQVVDPRGEPVTGARVSLDGAELGTTASSGTISLVELATGPRELSVVLPPYAPVDLRVSVGTNESTERVQLDWGVGAVQVQVTGADGLPAPDARLRLGGTRFVPATPVDREGRRLLALEPGTWQLLASSNRFTPAQIAFEVPDTPGLTPVDVQLDAPVAGVAEVLVRVQDPDGNPVPGASVTLDAEPPVSAGQGGLAVVRTQPGAHRLSVSAPSFQPADFDAFEVTTGTSERILPLVWEPRTVRVQVQGPDGPVQGAQVGLLGPAEVAPVRTDAQGMATVQVRPGRWRVLASAESLGAQAAELELPIQAEDREALVRLVLRKAQVEVAGADLTIEDTIYFDLGKASLKPASTPILDEVAATLQAHPEIVRLVVEGHTDTTGGVSFNMQLSRDRARAVVRALVARGVAPERLDARGFGPTRPVADNQTEEGRAANRRVELHGEVSLQPPGSGD